MRSELALELHQCGGARTIFIAGHMPCGLVGFVAVITDGCGEIKFPTLGYFVKSLLSLPHSNADVERKGRSLGNPNESIKEI